MTTASVLRLCVAFSSTKVLVNDVRLCKEANLLDQQAEVKKLCLSDLQSNPSELLPLRQIKTSYSLNPTIFEFLNTLRTGFLKDTTHRPIAFTVATAFCISLSLALF